MPTKRIPYIDLAKGICILLVVLSHAFNYYGQTSELNRTVGMFRMPLYYILSGLFFKTYEGLWGLTVRKINKLLVPIAFFSVIAIVAGHFLFNAPWPTSPANAFETAMHYNLPIWFLFSLFHINILFYLIILVVSHVWKTDRGQRFATCIIALCVGLFGLALSQTDINLPLYTGQALVGMPFFVFGWGLRQFTDFLHQPFHRRRDSVAIVLFLTLTAAMTSTVHFVDNYFDRQALFTLYPCGAMGAVALLLIAKLFTRIPLISYCGHYSIIILCTHFIIIQVLRFPIMRFGYEFQLGTTTQMWINFAVSLALSIALIPVGRHIFPHFTAQRDLFPLPKKPQPAAKPV